MPPPKKPKSGRTSLEQFLSDEERANGLTAPRSLRDSEGNSPAGSVDLDASDNEVFDGTKSSGSELGEIDLKSSENQATLLQKLFLKSTSVEEQKVPDSPDDYASPVSSPTGETPDRMAAFKQYRDHIRVQMNMKREENSHGHNSDVNHNEHSDATTAPDTEGGSFKTVLEEGEICETSSSRGSPQTNMTNATRLTSEQGRLIDTLVASALASSAAQSIIHFNRSLHDMTAGTGSSYSQVHRLSHSTMSSYDSEPHDLSKRTEMNNSKLLSQRLFENMNNGTVDASSVSHPYRGWPNRESKDITMERSKHYLDAHRHIVGLLSERSEEAQVSQDRTPVQVLEKENIVQSVPARYANGFFHHVGMNGVLGTYSRYEHNQRETLERAMNKVDQETAAAAAAAAAAAGGCMMSPGGYLPVHSMLPPTPTVGQSPTSTTMDLTDPRERYHPALMNPHLMPDSRNMRREPTHGSNVNKLCQVCSDNASGFHYGVWSCEGCKAFFKRSIQGPVDYVCPATNTCTIDKHRRKSCQACRLRKCYEVGMNKGSQRKERKSSSVSNGSTNSNASNKSLKRPRSESGDSASSSSVMCPTPVKNPRRSRTSVILEALGKADLPTLESYHNHNQPPTRVHLLNSLVKLAERELVLLINWAKNVPGYTDLTLGDQVHLIECCWMELLLLNCAFRSMEHHGRRLVFAPDLVLDRPYWSTLGMSDILEQVAAVSDQMVQFDLRREELLLLQATVLSNAEVRRLASYSKLQEIQQSILDSLVDTAQKYHPNNLRHIPTILLLLTHIRQAADRASAYFQVVKNEGVVTFCDLLTEMLDAQNEDKKPVISATPTSSS